MGVLNLRLCCFRDKGITSFNENEPSDTTDDRSFFFKENKSYGQNFSLGIVIPHSCYIKLTQSLYRL